MIENTFFQILSNHAPLTDLIEDKIYFEHNENQDEAEYLIYSKNSHLRPLSISGERDISNADFQIDVYSGHEDRMRQISEIITDLLNGLSNTVYDDDVQHIIVTDSTDFDSDRKSFRAIIQASVYFN